MKRLLVALLGKPKLEAAISVTAAELKKVIKWAIDNDQPTKVVNKLKKIQKAKERPSVGKPKPEGGSAKVAELRRIDDVGILYKGKTGSAAAREYRKTPEARYEMIDALKEEAKELGLSPSATAGLVKSATKYWQQLRRTAFPENVSSEDFLKSRMTPKELLQNRLAELKIQKPKLSGDDKMRAAAKFPSFSSVVDISKMKSLDEYTNNILKFAKDKYKSIGVELPPQVSDNLTNRAAIAWAKRTKVKPTKSPKPRKPYGYDDEPFKKGGSVKRPSMQKGGAYKGKKHSYTAGGKVNKLNF